MNSDEQKVIKLLIVALAVLTLLVVGLSVLFGLAFRNVQNSMMTAGTAEIVSAIKSIKVVNGQDGIDGLSIQGPPGANGKDSQSTTTIIQQPVNGTNGLSAYDIWLQNGNSGTQTDFLNSLKPVVACPDLQFDGAGNYRCHTSDDWLPLMETQ